MLQQNLTPYFNYAIEEARKNPIPEDKIFSISINMLLDAEVPGVFPERSLIEYEGGYRSILVQKLDEFELLLRMLIRPAIDEKYISGHLQHEPEHLDKAKEIYGYLGSLVAYYYESSFVKIDNGEKKVMPSYNVLFDNSIPEEDVNSRWIEVVSAPTILSPNDIMQIKTLQKDI